MRLRKALPISLLAVLPDLDALFLVHRSFSHSLTVVLGVMAPLLLLTHAFKPWLRRYALLTLFAVASHMILDLFTGYTPILWPLYGHSVRVEAELAVHVGGSVTLKPILGLLTRPVTFGRVQSLDASLFTGEGLILSTVLLAPVFFKAFKKLWPW